MAAQRMRASRRDHLSHHSDLLMVCAFGRRQGGLTAGVAVGLANAVLPPWVMTSSRWAVPVARSWR
jgi:hypothetical protein